MRLALTRFSGIAPKQTDYNLQASFAAVAENVNLARGTLQAWHQPLKIADATGQALYMADCCPITGDCHARFAKTGLDCDAIIAATGVAARPVFTTSCPPAWEPLGFPCNMAAPAVAAQTTGEDFSLELRAYTYTVVNRMGWESAPSLPSPWLRCNSVAPVTVSGFDVPPHATAIRIYRAQSPLDFGTEALENDDAVFLLVGEVPASTATFTDTVKVAGDACATEAYDPPPDDLRELASMGDRLCGLSGDSFLMSERSAPHAWNRKYRVQCYDTPRALVAAPGIAYILTDGRPQPLAIRGDCEDGIAIEPLDVYQSLPVVSRRSAAVHGAACVYASRHGLVLLQGNQAVIISRDFYTPEQWQALRPHEMVGAVCDGVYYGATSTACIRFDLPDDTFTAPDDTALTTLSLRPQAWHTGENGRLYYSDAAGVWLWDGGTEKMPYRWRGKVQYAAGNTRFAAFRLMSDGAVAVSHYSEHGKIATNTAGLQPTRLPVGRHGMEWQVEITGEHEVSAYFLATSVRDLAHD